MDTNGTQRIWIFGLKIRLGTGVTYASLLSSVEWGDYYMLETMQFVPGWTDFHLINGLRLDILIDMKGLEGYTFEECLNMSSIADIDGVQVPFLHINQLIANKKAVNLPKDQLDVIELERIKKIQKES